jgi:hypothetical protein
MPYIFTSTDQLNKALYRIDTMDAKQRKFVFDFFHQYMDDGVIADVEFENAIQKLSQKRIEYGLSEYDLENIKKFKIPHK